MPGSELVLCIAKPHSPPERRCIVKAPSPRRGFRTFLEQVGSHLMDDDKTNIIPFAEHAITRADLAEPADLTKASVRALLDAIEAQGFEGEAGPLEHSTEWIELKRRLTQP
jgi:hypothetical protein